MTNIMPPHLEIWDPAQICTTKEADLHHQEQEGRNNKFVTAAFS
jgi:hypothetical protein